MAGHKAELARQELVRRLGWAGAGRAGWGKQGSGSCPAAVSCVPMQRQRSRELPTAPACLHRAVPTQPHRPVACTAPTPHPPPGDPRHGAREGALCQRGGGGERQVPGSSRGGGTAGCGHTGPAAPHSGWGAGLPAARSGAVVQRALWPMATRGCAGVCTKRALDPPEFPAPLRSPSRSAQRARRGCASSRSCTSRCAPSATTTRAAWWRCRWAAWAAGWCVCVLGQPSAPRLAEGAGKRRLAGLRLVDQGVQCAAFAVSGNEALHVTAPRGQRAQRDGLARARAAHGPMLPQPPAPLQFPPCSPASPGHGSRPLFIAPCFPAAG